MTLLAVTKNISRLHSFYILTLALVGLFLIIRRAEWIGSVQTYALMEISASILAFVVGAMALVNYHSRGNKKYLITGYGFFALSIIDGFSAIQTTISLENSELALMISWSWFTSETFLAGLLIATTFLCRKNILSKIKLTPISVLSVIFPSMLISLIMLQTTPLPIAYYPDYLIHRPWESITIILYITVLIGNFMSGNWKTKYFEYSLLGAIIINIFAHVVFMTGSQQFFDTAFNSAYLLKLTSYGCIFAGLLMVMFIRSKQVATESGNRKIAQEALIKSESQHRAIFSTMADGIITINSKGTIAYFNKSAEKIFGYRLLEVLGRNINMLIPDPHHDRHNEYVANYIATGKGRIMGSISVVEGLRKDKSLFPIELSLGETTIGNEKIIHGVVRDITQRKQIEEALILARHDAEHSAQVKSDFLATMSHEIRTPMNGVLGMLELLLDTKIDSQQLDYLEIATNSGNALMEIINDILDFSKIESGKFELEKISFNLEIVGYDICNLLKNRANEKGLELILHYHSDCPSTFLGDPGRIRQILMNLVGNAIKFTNKGRIVIEVSSVICIENICTTKFSIQDSGIGIDRESQTKLFDSFTQADTSTSRRFGGTGLGLAICKNLVRLMGGIISVESLPDVGSTFSFTLHLPIVDMAPHTDTSTESLRDMRVLIIADCQYGRAVLHNHCLGWGMSVTEIASPHAIKKTLQQASTNNKPYQLIFVDIMHTGVNEKLIYQEIQSVRSHRNVPLVAVSSSVSAVDAELFQTAGYSALLTKPYLRETLFKLAKHTLSANSDYVSNNNLISHYSIPQNTNLANKEFKLVGKILLVEDVLVNQKVAMGLLKKCGLVPDLANNGVEAIKFWMNNHYDVIMMDCQMPELDGYQATKYIRENEESNHVTIIALTAHSLITDRQKCLDSGMDDYLSKPFNSKQLATILQKWLPTDNVDESEKTRKLIDKGITDVSSDIDTFNQSVIDLDILETLKEAIGDVFNEIIPAYLEQSDQMINDIEKLLSCGDNKTVERFAHSMKSSSYNVGAVNLSNIARDLEEKTRAGSNIGVLSTHINSLKHEYERVKKVLNNYQ